MGEVVYNMWNRKYPAGFSYGQAVRCRSPYWNKDVDAVFLSWLRERGYEPLDYGGGHIHLGHTNPDHLMELDIDYRTGKIIATGLMTCETYGHRPRDVRLDLSDPELFSRLESLFPAKPGSYAEFVVECRRGFLPRLRAWALRLVRACIRW